MTKAAIVICLVQQKIVINLHIHFDTLVVPVGKEFDNQSLHGGEEF